MPTDYRVVIPYREPTFSARQGRESDETFQAVYDVRAGSPDDARELALSRFHGDAEGSAVGWVREPIEDQITVRPSPAAGAEDERPLGLPGSDDTTD